MAAPSSNKVQFSEPVIAGSGCPAGTSSYTMRLSKNGQTLSIRFDANRAAPGNKTCNIAVSASVPKGFQVSMTMADYRGAVHGNTELRSSYFLVGGMGTPVVTRLSSPTGRSYLQSDNLGKMPDLLSKCGEDVNLRLNSRIRTTNNTSTASVNSLVLRMKYRRCNG